MDKIQWIYLLLFPEIGISILEEGIDLIFEMIVIYLLKIKGRQRNKQQNICNRVLIRCRERKS